MKTIKEIILDRNSLRIKEIRNQILKDAWNNHKAEWEMKEIALVLNLNLKTAYRIVKEERESNLLKHLKRGRK